MEYSIRISLIITRNADVHVTGSNFRFLSSESLQDFPGVGMGSVSFREYISAFQEWEEYYTYGGLPLILTCKDDEEKSEYLISIFQKVYLSDIMERRRIANMEKL